MNPHTEAEIYVCQSRTCKGKGSEGTLIEIEELAKIVGNCVVEETGCMGYCSQGPAVYIQHSDKRKTKSKKGVVKVRVNTFQRSKEVVEQASRQQVDTSKLSVETERQLTYILIRKQRQLYVDTYQWNKALAAYDLENIKDSNEWESFKLLVEKIGYKIHSSYAFLSPPFACFQNMPSAIENYVAWELKGIKIVSKHSAIFQFKSDNLKRGTPHPRGYGKQIEPVTWHISMLGEIGWNKEGPLPWIERDYTPISGALEWERGQCDIMIKIYPNGNLTSWLHQNHAQLGRKFWLSKPSKTLSIPSLTLDGDGFRPKSVLLLLAGTGIVALPQILAHRDPANKLGISTARYNQMPCPIDVIQSCRKDDILLLKEIKDYCIEGLQQTDKRKPYRGIRNYTLLLTDSVEQEDLNASPFQCFQNTQEHLPDIILADVPNASIMNSQRLNIDIVQNSLLRLEKPFRVVVSGPDTFNQAAREFLDECNVESGEITVLSA